MFDWDEDNIRHIAEHDVTPEECEQVIANDPVDVEEQVVDGEERLLQVGVTDALRCLEIVTTWRGELLRVVTAYAASPASRTYFSQRKWR